MTSEPYIIDLQPDYEGIAVNRLLQQFRESPRIVAFVRALARMVQCQENEQWAIIEAQLIGENTPLDLLRRWAAIIGERSPGSLTQEQLLQIVCARIKANTIGKADLLLNTQNFLDLIVEAFAPSQVNVTINPDGNSIILIDVISGPGSQFLPEGVGERAAGVVVAARPIGLLIRIVESTQLGFCFDTGDNCGFDQGFFGTRLYNGFGLLG